MKENLNVLIVEDNFSFCLEMEILVQKLNHTVIGIVDNSGDALVEILDKKPDIILMDIDIKGKLSGIDIADKIRHLKIPIIFITSFNNDEQYTKASSIENSTYIIKPVDQFTLKGAISLLMKYSLGSFSSQKHEELHLKEGALYLKRKNDFHRVEINDILYIESSRVYCKTITKKNDEFLNRISLNEYSLLLNCPNFIKPHRSFLVNSNRITKVNLNENVIIIDEHNVPISRSAKNELKDFFKLIN